MIIRTPRPKAHFTILPNAAIRDARLSWKARGMLAYLLSLPDNWRTSTAHLQRVGPDGREAVRRGLIELEDAGYLVRRRVRLERGRFSWVHMVYDTPVDNPVDDDGDNPSPSSDSPSTVNASSIEVPTIRRKNVSKRLSPRARRICGLCNGSARIITEGDVIATCPACTDGTV